MKWWALYAALGIRCGVAIPVLAQAGSPGLEVGLGAGPGYGWGGGERTDRIGFVTDILAAWHTSTGANARGIFGIDASWQWQPDGDAICVIGRNGTCVPGYPNFNAVSIVAGREWTRGWASGLRLLAGPGYCAGTDEHGQRTANVFGLETRLDGVTALTEHVAITTAARINMIPRFHGQFYGPGTLMVGVRFQ